MAFSLESITSDIEKVNTSVLGSLFPEVALPDLERPEGPVNLMLGLNYATLHPQTARVVGDMRLLKSLFGTGYLVDGVHPEIDSCNIVINHLAHRYGQSEVRSTVYRDIQRVNLQES